MSRAFRFRATARFVLLPIAALLSTECGGNDVVDPADASTDGTFDSGTFDDVSDALLVDRTGETSSDDSTSPDAGADGDGSRDAGDAGLEGGPPALALGRARTFALLSSNTITNAGTTTAVTGDVGISPGIALVNLSPGQVMGTIHLGDDAAAFAESDMALAYEDLAARPCGHTMSGTDLGGQTLAPGVYCFAAGAAQSAGVLTLDGEGDSNASWVFQIGSTLTVATNVSTNLINGASGCNVYWQVGSSATINTGARFIGSVLAKVSVTLLTGASVSPGRILAETAAVTLDSNAISTGGCP